MCSQKFSKIKYFFKVMICKIILLAFTKFKMIIDLDNSTKYDGHYKIKFKKYILFIIII